MSLRGKKAADPRDQYWIDTVAAHGHAIVKIADAIDEPSDEPPFAYSLGVQESYGAPEFILFGLDGDIAAQVINNIVADLRSGRVLRCGVQERGFSTARSRWFSWKPRGTPRAATPLLRIGIISGSRFRSGKCSGRRRTAASLGVPTILSN